MRHLAVRSVDQAARVGVAVTWLCLAVLTVLAMHPDWLADGAQRARFLGALAVAGAVVVPMSPSGWRRWLVERFGARLLQVWSTLDVLIIAVGVAATGDSALAHLFVLPVVFFSSMLAAGSQVALLVLIGGSYGLSVSVGWVQPSVPELVVWATTVAAAAGLVAFLSAELRRRERGEREAQEAARLRSELVTTVADAAQGVFALDPDDVLERVVSAASTLGFETAAVLQRDDSAGGYRATHHVGLPDWYVDAPHPMDLGVVGRVFAQGRTSVSDCYRKDPWRIDRFVEDGFRAAVAAPVRLSDDEIPAVLVAATRRRGPIDTARVEAVELLCLHAGAALSNAERFREQQQLTRRLQEIDGLKSRFVETASHELRTPVTVVKAALELLQRHGQALDADRHDDLVRRASAHANDLVLLIERLTKFRHVDRDVDDADVRPVQLRPLIVSAVDRAAARCRTHLLTWGADADLTVRADPDLVSAVLDALLDNACTHTPEGTHVQVTCRCEDDHAVVSVTDDGPGMPDEVIRSIGRAFSRGTATLHTRGLGLGLATVVRALHAQATSLEVSGAPGGGTAATFRLALAPNPAPPAGDAHDIIELHDLASRSAP